MVEASKADLSHRMPRMDRPHQKLTGLKENVALLTLTSDF